MKAKRLVCLLVATVLLICGCVSGCARISGEPMTYTGTAFDTVISIQIYDSHDEDILNHCINMCQDFENKFSDTIPTSEISQINAAAGAPVTVSADTITVLQKGLYYGELSNGAFDITVGRLSSIWDFKTEGATPPAADVIADAVSHTDYKNVEIVDNTVTLKDPFAALDVGGIAKGYIADRLKDYLVSEGINRALINLGGNVLAIGEKPDGTAFNIGVQKPFDESGSFITSVKIKGQSVVTSGTYQRYFEYDGKRYHHILDPKTGNPCDNGLASVTIITDSSLTADALSTTCFVLGPELGLKLANQLDNVDAIFITTDDKVTYSNNFQE